MRGFLVGVAGSMLWLIVIGPPLLAFFAAGGAAATWDGFNTGAGIMGAIAAFVLTSPGAALLAVFLDIRDRLENIDRKSRG